MLKWIQGSITQMNVVEWLKLAALVLAAPWALITFRRNNRIKAAEILVKLEDECHKCLPTLLVIEYTEDYETKYKPAIKKANAAIDRPTGEPVHYTQDESKAIEALDQVFRHFLACAHVKRLGVDAGALDRAYAYYLKTCISDGRPELRRYLQEYWPTVFFWAELAGEPWPKRVSIGMNQVCPRLRFWWWGFPPRPTAGPA